MGSLCVDVASKVVPWMLVQRDVILSLPSSVTLAQWVAFLSSHLVSHQLRCAILRDVEYSCNTQGLLPQSRQTDVRSVRSGSGLV